MTETKTRKSDEVSDGAVEEEDDDDAPSEDEEKEVTEKPKKKAKTKKQKQEANPKSSAKADDTVLEMKDTVAEGVDWSDDED